MTDTADVVIIGGGVNGSSIAYHLAKRGFGKIVLVEKNALASGSTGKSAGIVRQHYSNPVIIQMVMESRKFFEGIAEELGGYPGFVQNVFLLLVAEQEKEALKANVAAQRDLGLEVDLVPPDELSRFFPGINTEGVALASYEDTSGYADPHGTSVAFAEKAKQLGVDLQLGCQVLRLLVKNDAIYGVETDRGVIETQIIVNAAGPWGKELVRPVGIELPLIPRRLQETVVKSGDYGTHNPTVIDLHQLVYFKPEPGGLILVGGGITDDTNPVNPDQYKEQADFETIADVTERLAFRMPDLAEASFIRGWAGVITVTPDFHPILGKAPELDGLIHAMSCSGHG
ncbi:MAG: FAD-binding oxidoreductase, partial [Candidatus Latescibacteria bacterium]|nr:FAD-binding oxidoreductase [Candidatus Latescibacterota bacterium]